jgi:leader peptidase (prepilin peptidase)/N-methyltransferase
MLPELALYIWVFAFGAVIGSFLNVCIYRLPLEKSLIWPGSRCGSCLQAVRWYDNIPLVSYGILRGRCRSCRARFSPRYFFIELLTAGLFLGLFYLEFTSNIHDFDARVLGPNRFMWARIVVFAYHSLLLSFLLVATFCDFDRYTIPLSLTVTGTLAGLVGAMLFPWPWPYTPAEVIPANQPFQDWRLLRFHNGVYPWPLWGPLPDWLAPGGNWLTGLATGLAGAFAGTMILRLVRFLFGFGRGAELMEPEYPDETENQPGNPLARAWRWVGRVGGRALGLGDADLMMMAGAFLGWQLVLVAFFVSVVPGLFMGLLQMVLRGNQVFPFGPALAAGIMITALFWQRGLGAQVQPLFFDGTLMLILAGMGSVFMLAAGYVLRLVRLFGAGEKVE